jgi:FtsP/CotA-like multicopper oxidase with cupredoxin domain
VVINPVHKLRSLLFPLVALLLPAARAPAQADAQSCPRPQAGTEVRSPAELRSTNGVLRASLSLENSQTPDGHMRYCYIADGGGQAPTLRLSPGDLLILTLKNKISLSGSGIGIKHAMSQSASCSGSTSTMDPSSTNLHFHGLAIPPKCHQDETVTTLIPSSSAPFEYRFHVPQDAPPGLYWYHPHVHGFSEEQVLGGASGALIVQGIERANKLIAGLPERILVIRDQKIANSKPDPNRPGKDLSVNFVPVVYPDLKPAIIQTRASAREFWRVLNASADTYLDLKVVFNDKAQFLGVVGLDGIPIGFADGSARNRILWESHLSLPPAGRVEFVFNGPPEGVKAALLTQAVETGPVNDNDSPPPPGSTPVQNSAGGDNDNTPARTLATIVSSSNAPELASVLPGSARQADSPSLAPPTLTPLSAVTPIRQRKFYFSEKVIDAKDPNSPTIFYITEEGKVPAPFDPASTVPNIVVHQGDVEDWLIENRSQETHAFHIHQTHFLILERHGVPVQESYLRDTINVPYWDGFSPQYPSIKLRMDFRDPNIVGTFPYHCHILQHEDGGMMGTIRVEAIDAGSKTQAARGSKSERPN